MKASLMNKSVITVSPINILNNNDDILEWSKKELLLHRSLPRPLVSFHKERLGPQHYCLRGSEYQFWVWESGFNDERNLTGYRVYVNNKKGVCFEVTQNCDKKDISLCFADYLSALDLELTQDGR